MDFGDNKSNYSLRACGLRLPASEGCGGAMATQNEARLTLGMTKNMIAVNRATLQEAQIWRGKAAQSAFFWTVIGMGSLIFLSTLLIVRVNRRRVGVFRAQGAILISSVGSQSSACRQGLGVYLTPVILSFFSVLLLIWIPTLIFLQSLSLVQFESQVEALPKWELPIEELASKNLPGDILLTEAKLRLKRRLLELRDIYQSADQLLTRFSAMAIFGWDQVAGIDLQMSAIEYQSHFYERIQHMAAVHLQSTIVRCGGE
jgi:hypothetical protein